VTPEQERQPSTDATARDIQGSAAAIGTGNSVSQTHYYQSVELQEIRRTRDELTHHLEQLAAGLRDDMTTVILSITREVRLEEHARREADAAIAVHVTEALAALTQTLHGRRDWCRRCTLGTLALLLVFLLFGVLLWFS
jgi:hypothetical protein